MISNMGTRSSTGNPYVDLQNLPMILILLYLFLIFQQLTAAISDGQPPLYKRPDNIAIGCGFSGSNRERTGRTWQGDINSEEVFSSLGQNNASKTYVVVAGTYIDNSVPYETARISRSNFTYTVPVSTPGPKFIRLHFFSAQYENSNLSDSNAFFSVEADHAYTLLRNFSVFLTAGDLDPKKVIKEFLITVERSVLHLKFTPSSSISGAFAFVNGIEVVSVPNNLYYSEQLNFVGENSLYDFQSHTALATMYRVNIGGKEYPDDDNIGMFRKWEKQGDKYLTIPGDNVVPSNTQPVINFSSPTTPAYSAPEGVYQSALSMGLNRTENLNYNLTWEFPVDPRFFYLVRLHFCEIGTLVNSTNDRVFGIFIANQSAEQRADVIYWSKGKYVPYFRDYIVPMFIEKQTNLSVALQAYSDRSISTYADAILNGIEIFKLNNSLGDLAGPNPDPISKMAPNSLTSRSKGNGKYKWMIIGIVSGLVILSFLGFFVLQRRRKVKNSASSEGTNRRGHISLSATKSRKTRGSSLPSDLCRYFSFAEISAATNDFDDIFIIGVGGFGKVYKGYVDNGTTPVAIKRLKPESSQGANEFKTEIEMLSHLRHRNLVSLIGYCNDDREMILVYDYMARGTLRQHLYDSDNSPLSWKQRLEICIGAAQGLQYLHTGGKRTIIHRDVKTTNILLDEKWVSKFSDFGLSKMGPTGISKAHVSTVVKGSVGYLDPEYYKRQQLTEKSDVYSFGVVLCEVLCARPPILRTAGNGKVSLAEWAPSCYHDGTLDQIIDPYLMGKIAPECLKKYGEIFVNCMLDNGAERPSMNDIVWGLEFALQLQQSAEDNDSVGGAIIKPKGEDEVPFIKTKGDNMFSSSCEDSSESSIWITKFSSSEQGSTTNESIKGMAGAVFSEINTDPRGR